MADTSTTSRPGTGPGSSSDDLREQLTSLKSDLTDLSETVREQAKKGLDTAQEKAVEKVEDLEAQIRKNPLAATAIAAGVGFLLGAILSR